MRRRISYLPISRKKSKQLESTNRRVWFSSPERWLSWCILVFLSRRQSQSNQEPPKSANLEKQISLKLTESMILLKRRKERRLEEDPLQNPWPSSKATFWLCRNSSRKASMKKLRRSMTTKKGWRQRESSRSSASLSSLWSTLTTITWTALLSSCSRSLNKDETRNSESQKST